MVDSEGFRLRPEPAGWSNRPHGRQEPDRPDHLELLSQQAHQVSNRNAGIHFRHRTWHADRSRVLAALEAPGLGGRRFWRFRDCGSEPIVYRDPSDPDRYKVGCKRCHDRFCLPCSQDRARLIVANLKEQLPDAPTRFLTLTLKHNSEPLRDQLDRLAGCFVQLRRRKFWREKVDGGAAFTELKLARGDNRWHPHLHVLIRGKYLPQAAIADAWLQITGDSHIVDIRLARDAGQIYRYLAHYVTKGWSPGIYRDHDRLVEAIQAMKGRKLLACFGTFTKLELLKPPTPETWVALGTLQQLIERARDGDTDAQHVLGAINAPGWEPPPEPVPPEE